MKTINFKIISSQMLRSFLILTLVYFSQINPLLQLNHTHLDVLTELEENTHSGSHATDHHHHDDSSHDNDHQHNFDNQIDWQIVRTQTLNNIRIENEYFLSSVLSVLVQDRELSHIDFLQPPIIDRYNTSSLIVRGPPLFI